MLVQKLEQLVKEIKRRLNYEYINLGKEREMPQGKGTYGTTKGRPPAKKKMTAKQKTLPSALQKKIMASKKKK